VKYCSNCQARRHAAGQQFDEHRVQLAQGSAARIALALVAVEHADHFAVAVEDRRRHHGLDLHQAGRGVLRRLPEGPLLFEGPAEHLPAGTPLAAE
jgi:hypothetical protein